MRPDAPISPKFIKYKMQKFSPKKFSDVRRPKRQKTIQEQAEFFPRSFTSKDFDGEFSRTANQPLAEKKWNPGPFVRISEIAESIKGSKQLQATLKKKRPAKILWNKT